MMKKVIEVVVGLIVLGIVAAIVSGICMACEWFNAPFYSESKENFQIKEYVFFATDEPKQEFAQPLVIEGTTDDIAV